jgi:hypothetical protein
MPPWVDISFFDVCARTLLGGEQLYRDIFIHGPPGVILIQSGLRALLGWRSEMLCVADFLILTSVVALLVGPLQPRQQSTAARLWTACVLYGFYFATSEWCHCEPDMWMLLPALLAVCLRQRRLVGLLRGEQRGTGMAVQAVLEGVFWGLAFVVKPHVAVPAVACWLVWGALVRRRRPGWGRDLAVDAGLVVIGGLLVGAATGTWLWRSGNWPYFRAAVLGGWNWDYLQVMTSLVGRFIKLVDWYVPWSMIHLAALPAAIDVLTRSLSPRTAVPSAGAEPAPSSQPLLAALYLGWLVEANVFQQQFDYHLVPPVLLAIALLAGHRWVRTRPFVLGLIFPIVLAVAVHPLLRGERWTVWGRCWREGSSARVRDRLTVIEHHVAPNWQELKQVQDFLRSQDVRDGELTCFSLSTLHLYREMNLKPSTRYVMLWSVIFYFRHHWAEVERDLKASRARFVVVDLRSAPLPAEAEARFCRWPQAYAFRTNRYIVYRTRGDDLPAGQAHD